MEKNLKKYYIYLQTMFGTSNVEFKNAYKNKYLFTVGKEKYIEIEKIGDGNWIMRGTSKQ